MSLGRVREFSDYGRGWGCGRKGPGTFEGVEVEVGWSGLVWGRGSHGMVWLGEEG